MSIDVGYFMPPLAYVGRDEQKPEIELNGNWDFFYFLYFKIKAFSCRFNYNIHVQMTLNPLLKLYQSKQNYNDLFLG